VVAIPIFLAFLPSFTYLGATHEANEIWQMFCLAISFMGLAIRILTVGRAPLGTSGRNTREQVANTLNTTGIYSLVRHPLYLGNYLILIGMALWPHIWWLAVLTSCFFALYYERIMLAEEAFLREKFGEFLKPGRQRPPLLFRECAVGSPPQSVSHGARCCNASTTPSCSYLASFFYSI
jgi:protein-S-isoprenylcysteine O-methyltransferase Ste14